jgi:hypothetical protein
LPSTQKALAGTTAEAGVQSAHLMIEILIIQEFNSIQFWSGLMQAQVVPQEWEPSSFVPNDHTIDLLKGLSHKIIRN